MIKQHLFTRSIGSQSFSVLIPCVDSNDAKDIASKTGMSFEGFDVCTVPCIPVFQLMMFMQSLVVGESIEWKPNAQEQIEAFIECGWPEQTHEQ